MRELSALASELGMVIDNETSHRVRVRGKRGRKTDLCNCGYESLDVFSDGQVYPCVWFSGAPNLACGSILERSLKEIWLTSPTLAAIRENSVQRREGCSECHFKYLCGGGTNCSSYFDSLARTGRGSFQAAEPYCETLMDLTYDRLFELAAPEGARGSPGVPVVYEAMEGEGAECARPNTTALDRGIEVGSFHCSCVLQADVADGQRVSRARAKTPSARVICFPGGPRWATPSRPGSGSACRWWRQRPFPPHRPRSHSGSTRCSTGWASRASTSSCRSPSWSRPCAAARSSRW